jgi:hypothetical protein
MVSYLEFPAMVVQGFAGTCADTLVPPFTSSGSRQTGLLARLYHVGGADGRTREARIKAGRSRKPRASKNR